MSDPFQSQADEVLLQIFYHTKPEDLPALCSSSPLFHRICGEPALRKRVLLGKYLNIRDMSFLQRSFLDLVSDSIRNPSPGISSSYVSVRDIEHLTAMLQARPELIKVIPGKRYNSEELLGLTRNPQITDLLLRNKAQASNALLSMRIEQRVANSLLLSQIVAYRGSFPKELIGTKPGGGAFGTRAIASIPELQIPFIRFLVECQYISLGEAIYSIFDWVMFEPLTYYFLILQLLRSGAKTTDLLLPGSASTLYNMIMLSSPSFLFKLIHCYEDRNISRLTVRTPLTGELLSWYISLLSTPEVKREGYLSLDYQHLKQLQNKGLNPFWDDDSFWRDKIVLEYPGQSVEGTKTSTGIRSGTGIGVGSGDTGSTARLRYLYLYTTPILEFDTSSGKRSIILDYYQGLGFLTCRHLSGLRDVQPYRMRLMDSSTTSNIETALGHLYQVRFPDAHLRTINDDNLNLNLVAIEDNNGLDIKIPSVFRPYAMALPSLEGDKVYYLQFPAVECYTGYLLLCKLVGIEPVAIGYNVIQ